MEENYQMGVLDELNLRFLLLIISFWIGSIILYLILKKKYHFEMKNLFYSVGFASCNLLLFISIQAFWERIYNLQADDTIWETYAMFTLSALTLTLFYYSYASLLQNNKNEHNQKTLFLTVMTALSFGFLLFFEIMKYQAPLFSASFFIYGLYFVCCLIFTKARVSLRGLAWTPFLPAFIIGLYLIMAVPH
ncbi:MAG: hypothetical protein LBU81_02935 [Methanosarcinales archaeon]|jgi:hypothetical protein|nr:hypothetical protein [Methanosarcinales archaeon]